MMSIPLYFLLFGYIIFLGVFGFFFVTNLFHLVGTGTFTKASMLITAVLIVAALLVLEITWELLAPVNFGGPAVVWDGKALSAPSSMRGASAL